MQKKFYLDSCIWRDYFEDRTDYVKPLGELAFRFLKQCEKRKDFVIVSDAVKKELLDYYSEEKLSQVFSSFKNIILEIDHSKAQSKKAFDFWIKNSKKFPFYDVLHSVIAKDNNAVLITRDRHFEELGIAEFSLPEDVF